MPSAQSSNPAAERRSHARRVRVIVCGAVASACVLAVALLVGCAVTIVEPRAVRDPVRVYIADYGRHASVILPNPDGGSVEYTYGEWGWFALNKDDWWRTPGVVLLPSRGALGRGERPAFESAADAYDQMLVAQVHELTVERDRAAALERRLRERFEARADTAHYNPRYELEFVHDSDAYWLCNHCNSVVASWVRELGCEVRGVAVGSDFRVRRAQSPSPAPDGD